LRIRRRRFRIMHIWFLHTSQAVQVKKVTAEDMTMTVRVEEMTVRVKEGAVRVKEVTVRVKEVTVRVEEGAAKLLWSPLPLPLFMGSVNS
jgi:hypothetical protein